MQEARQPASAARHFDRMLHMTLANSSSVIPSSAAHCRIFQAGCLDGPPEAHLQKDGGLGDTAYRSALNAGWEIVPVVKAHIPSPQSVPPADGTRRCSPHGRRIDQANFIKLDEEPIIILVFVTRRPASDPVASGCGVQEKRTLYAAHSSQGILCPAVRFGLQGFW